MYGIKGRSTIIPSDELAHKAPKTLLEDLSKNIELAESAILRGKKILCKEFVWNSAKQRVAVDGGKVLSLTPIRIERGDKYFLYAYDGTAVRVFRLDNIFDVSLSSEDAVGADEYKAFLNDARYSVDFENVRLDCANCFAGEVFDKFGLGVTVLSNREESFEITVKVKLDDSFYAWLFNNSKHIRIVSPERVKEDYKERLLLAIDNAERKP